MDIPGIAHECGNKLIQITCVIDLFAASWSTLPILTWTGFRRRSPAIFRTSLGQVAVYISVCLCGGISFTILRIWGSKPMSSIRSASSSTRRETCLKSILFISRMSLSRPGVATTISVPRSSSFNWWTLGAPPYKHWNEIVDRYLLQESKEFKWEMFIYQLTVQETLADRPNFSASSCICVASSRVGDKTTTVGPFWGLLRRRLRWTNAGIR